MISALLKEYNFCMDEQLHDRLYADGLPKVSISDLKRWGAMTQYYDSFNLFLGDYRVTNSVEVRAEVFFIEKDRGCLTADAIAKGNYIRFCDPQKDYFDQEVKLCSTGCNFGGCRYWFCCPSCEKSVGVLYFRNDQFACRNCYNLTYRSRNMSRSQRLLNKIISEPELERIERRIKRRQYNGMYTRKYSKYIQKKHRSRVAYVTEINHFVNKLRLRQI